MPYIGQGLTEGRRRLHNFVATSNQTTFIATYDVGYIDVYQNGILLTSTDYTATNGTTVVLAVGASSSDEITIIAHQIFSITDTVSAITGGAFGGNVDVTGNITTTGSLRGPSSFTIDPATHGDNTGTVVIAGDLTVNGTTTTINSTTLTVDDKNLILASGTSNSSTADGSGLTIDLGSDGTATMVYTHATTSIDFNKTIKSPGATFTDAVTFNGNNYNIAFYNSSNALKFFDYARAEFGTGGDLKIRHTGSHSEIKDEGTGQLRIISNVIHLRNSANDETMLMATENGAVELYHANSKKIETTSTGVTVTGVTASTGFSGKIHPVNGTTTNYLSLKDGNELNFYNSSDASQTLHINYDGGNVDLAGSSVEITHGGGAIFKKVVQIQGDNLTTNLLLRGRSTDQNFYTLYKSYNGAATHASFGTDASNDTFNYQVDNHAFQNLASNNTYMYIKSDGKVGIGETSPANILHIKTSASGGPQIELDSTSGTANSAFINFDGTSLQLSTQRDMVDGSKRDTAKSWGGINIVGVAAGSYINFQTSEGNNNAVGTRMTITKEGDVGIGATNPGGSKLYLQDTHTTTVTNATTMLSNTTLTINGNSSQGSDVIRMGPMGTGGKQFIDVSNSAGSAAYDLLLNPIGGGNVGIGTTSASKHLHIYGTNPTIQVQGNSSSYYPRIDLTGLHGGLHLGTYWGGNITSASDFSIWTGGTGDGGTKQLQIQNSSGKLQTYGNTFHIHYGQGTLGHGNEFQFLTTELATPTSGSWYDVCYVSHSPCLRFHGMSVQSNNPGLGGARYMGALVGTYGSVACYQEQKRVTAMNGGGVSDIDYRYLNSGASSGSYRLQVKLNFSGSDYRVYTCVYGNATAEISKDGY